MGLSSSLRTSRRRVPRHHRPGAPAREHHEVALGAAFGEPAVREVMPKLMGVQALDPCSGRSAPQHLADAGARHRPLEPEPQSGESASGRPRRARRYRSIAFADFTPKLGTR